MADYGRIYVHGRVGLCKRIPSSPLANGRKTGQDAEALELLSDDLLEGRTANATSYYDPCD